MTVHSRTSLNCPQVQSKHFALIAFRGESNVFHLLSVKFQGEHQRPENLIG